MIRNAADAAVALVTDQVNSKLPPLLDEAVGGALDVMRQTTETVINAGAFGLQGYPHDDTAAFLAARSAALQLGIRRVYVPAAPATAFDPAAPLEFRRPHYLSGELPIDANFEWYGDGRGLSNIRIRAKDMRQLFFVDSGSATVRIPGFRVRDLSLWGRSDEYSSAHVSGDGTEHYSLLVMHGVEDAEISRVGLLAPRGDGILLGGGDAFESERHNRNVRLIDVSGDGYNWQNRNGISIIDGDGILIQNPDFRRFTSSAMPGAIDIEPNKPGEIARNIRIVGGYLNSGGSTGIFTMHLNNPVGNYTILPSNITMEGTILDGAGPGRGRVVGVWLSALGEVEAGINQQISLDFTARNVQQAYSVEGVAGVRLSGKAVSPSAFSFVGGPNKTHAVRDLELALSIEGGAPEGQLIRAAHGLRWTGRAEGVAYPLILAPDGVSSGLDLRPLRVGGAAQMVRQDAGHQQQGGNRWTPPADQPGALAVPIVARTPAWMTPAPVGEAEADSAALPSRYPIGRSVHVVAGAAGWPATFGTVETYIDQSGYGRNSGFCWQRFTQFEQGEVWVRSKPNGADQWLGWKRLTQEQVVAPALTAGVAAGPNPTKAEYDALRADVAALRAALTGAGRPLS